MAIIYTFTKYKDVYTIQNNGIVPFTYSINKQSCESTSPILSNGLLNPNTTAEIKFPTDGVFIITLDTGEETTTITVTIYNNLLLSFINSVEKILCGCSKCNDCEDCNNCEDYWASLMKGHAFNLLNYPTYQTYFNTITQENICDFTDNIICSITREKVFGNIDIKEVTLKMIAYYYLSFFFKDFYSALDAEEAAYISIKYKFDKISKCLKKLGISSTETLEVFEQDAKVYYWQLNNIEDTIENIIPLLSEDFFNEKPFLPLTIFEQGHIVNYSQIGRICFAIKPTEIQNFLLVDSLNNDITDAFDIYYDSILKAVLYVSKVPYSYGDVYFKFKKLVP